MERIKLKLRDEVDELKEVIFQTLPMESITLTGTPGTLPHSERLTGLLCLGMMSKLLQNNCCERGSYSEQPIDVIT